MATTPLGGIYRFDPVGTTLKLTFHPRALERSVRNLVDRHLNLSVRRFTPGKNFHNSHNRPVQGRQSQLRFCRIEGHEDTTWTRATNCLYPCVIKAPFAIGHLLLLFPVVCCRVLFLDCVLHRVHVRTEQEDSGDVSAVHASRHLQTLVSFDLTHLRKRQEVILVDKSGSIIDCLCECRRYVRVKLGSCWIVHCIRRFLSCTASSR